MYPPPPPPQTWHYLPKGEFHANDAPSRYHVGLDISDAAPGACCSIPRRASA